MFEDTCFTFNLIKLFKVLIYQDTLKNLHFQTILTKNNLIHISNEISIVYNNNHTLFTLLLSLKQVNLNFLINFQPSLI